MLYFINKDTICAPATGDGKGAIAVIRISGPEAISLVNKIYTAKDLSKEAGYTIHFGKLYHPTQSDDCIDEVLVSLFKSPKSYTGEDIIEISCHGSKHIQQKILEALVEVGCRLALPGEFTFRAFVNGKLDLSQAEAVSDLIAGQNDLARKTALNQMRGGYSKLLENLRQELIDFAALIELELDFGEEDVEFANREKLIGLIHHISQVIDGLIGSFSLGNAIKNGIPTAIIGKPNAGKSTLLNVLLKEEKAIVSHIAGTTRDVVEDILTIKGFDFRLMDTAGLRNSSDSIEQQGIERSKQKARQARLVIYVYDAAESEVTVNKDISELNLSADIYIIKVANKTDIFHPTDKDSETIYISAKNNTGIDSLLERMIALFDNVEASGQEYIVTNARHYEALLRARQALEESLSGLKNQISGELVAFELRGAIHHIGEITGNITNDDLLSSIFTRFCIGK